MMDATTVLRWFHRRSDPPVVQRVIVEAEEQLALRNQQKLEEAKQALGGRYVLHSSNKVIRKREERPRALAARVAKPDTARASKQGSPVENNA
jgi:hypothetical protein